MNLLSGRRSFDPQPHRHLHGLRLRRAALLSCSWLTCTCESKSPLPMNLDPFAIPLVIRILLAGRRLRFLPGCCLAAFVSLQVGCSSSVAPVSSVHPQTGRHVLSPGEAAQRAATLANDECDRLYRRRPFSAEQHHAVRVGDQYRWGGLDEGGKGGFSALVVLGTDGRPRTVEVYFSTDALMPTGIPAPDSQRAQPGRR